MCPPLEASLWWRQALLIAHSQHKQPHHLQHQQELPVRKVPGRKGVPEHMQTRGSFQPQRCSPWLPLPQVLPWMPMSSLHAANTPHLQVHPCSICTAVIHSAESSSSTVEHTSNQTLAFKRVKEKAESSQMPQPCLHLSIKPPQGLLPTAQTCLISLIIAFSVTLTIYIPCSDISCAFPIIFSTEELQST